MEIYLLRHGIAADRGTGVSADDASRPLTEEGVAAMKKGAEGMRRLELEFDRILTSPLVRARQTAEIVARRLGAEEKLEETDSLGHGFSPPAVCALLSDLAPIRRFLLVGHQPDLCELASYLLAGNEQMFIPLKKGALCRIDVQDRPSPASGALIWLLAPRQLRMLGGE